jgi:hypothetical protein
MAQKVHIERLKLTGFRNYANQSLETSTSAMWCSWATMARARPI